ncbi:MAG TPA: hypothetical protein VG497_02520 [Kribbella sp.]|nr:hypothetical protein [Kribbella sp.]
MPFDVARFTAAFSDANHRRRTEQAFDVAAEQAELRELLGEADPTQRAWALDLIESLAEPMAPRRERSELYAEATRIYHDVQQIGGTTTERIAALETARRKIWDLADQASADEESDIRALTRPLEHLETNLRDPLFPHDSEPWANTR